MFIKFGPQVDILERISGVTPSQVLLRLSTSGHKTHKSSCDGDFCLMIATKDHVEMVLSAPVIKSLLNSSFSQEFHLLPKFVNCSSSKSCGFSS